MGNALSTSAWMILTTVLLVVMAILIIVVIDRTKNITGFSTNSNLTSAHTRLVWAQVFAWIAAGLALLLVIGYIALHFLVTSEWIHLILWILLFAALIASMVLLAIALRDIDNSGVSNTNGATGYIWGALIVGGATLIVLLISGGWRVAQKSTEDAMPDQYYVPADAGVPMGAAELPPQPQVQVTTQPGTATAPLG